MDAMGVQETLDLLKRAQELDREIYRIRQEIEQVPETIQEFLRTFEKEKSQLTQLESQLKEIQLRQKQREGELAEKEVLIRKYDSQLSLLKTNKEYATMQHEISALKADNSIIEDKILNIFEEIEKVQRQVREERERLAVIEKENQGKKKALEDQEQKLKTNLAELSTKRAEAVKQVLPKTRELYEKIIQRKKGLALVQVEGDACGACRIEIRPQLLNDIKLKEVIVLCEHCSRILYHD